MKKLLCLIIVVSMLIALPAFETGAREYTPEQMAEFLNSLDILHGDASKGGDYDFYSYLTRAQFAKLAVASSPYKNSVPAGTNTSPYSDVKRDHWAAGYIKVAVLNKLVTGYPDSTFRPENNVLLEEAVTIALKILGYENSDFGGEWPYGQMGIANNIGLLDGVEATTGMAITRKDAIALIFNTLNADTKSGSSYITSLGYDKKEEVVLVSSYYQDPSIDIDKVVTSEGTYKVKKNFDFSKIGMRGDILLRNGKEIVGFYSDGQKKENYIVTGILGNDIVVNKGGSNSVLDIGADTAVYYNSTKITYSTLSQKVSAGDSVSVVKDETGRIKYMTVESQNMQGPITVKSTEFLSSISMNADTVTVIKAGSVSSVNDVKINDIIYYSKNLNTIWVYQDRRTGVYEQALPNQEFPTSIVLSGTNYEIESAEALTKLSSTGNFKLGQSVTLLLGKDGKVADVITSGSSNEVVYGYTLETGSKQYTINGETYSSYYMTVVTPDGNEYEYTTERQYDSLRSKAVKLTFTNSQAKATLINEGGVSGVFNLTNMTLGTNKLARDINIIEVKDTDSTETPEYIKVYSSRLDGVNISSSNVLYYGKNTSGEINSLILKDVTGDCYDYGVILKANEKEGTSYIVDGNKGSTGTFFTISARTPARLDIRGNKLNGVGSLQLISNISNFTDGYITDSAGKKHYLSGTVSIYYVNDSYDYMLTTLSDAITNKNDYRISAYYDKTAQSGGRVRVIILRDKY